LKFSPVSLAVALVALATDSLSADQPPKREYGEAEAHRVYDALLSSQYFYKRPDHIVWVIQTETEGGISPKCMPKPADLDFDDWQIVRDFVGENRSAKILDTRFGWSTPVVTVSSRELQDLLGRDLVWDRFHSKYPESSGTLVFSAVGFNERRDRALVSTTFECGLLCGGIRFQALERRSNVWRVVESPIPCFTDF
jgi:hypothetical protein